MTEHRHGASSPLSILAPGAVGLLPALVLGFLPGEKGESYEWSQHLAAGLIFGAVFAVAFLCGGWRRHWATTVAGAGVLSIAAVVIGWQGLPGFQVIFAVAGAMVGGGYWFTQRREPAMVMEAVWVAAGSTFGLWALSRLSFWTPFSQTLETWGNRAWFLGITAALVGCLGAWHRAQEGARPGRTFRLLDAAMLVILAAAVIRTTDLVASMVSAHHWSVYVAPAEMVREGRMLLGQVPSQYGFLNILILAGLPAANCYVALYWLQVAALWLSGTVLYFVLRTWLAGWWWQIGAGLIAVVGVAFFCGDLAQLSGPMVYPNVGAVRFIWVYLLLGYLVWWQQGATPPAASRKVVWIGSALWLGGVFWSVESAVYVTAAWLPAASLLAMPATAGGGGLPRLRALGAGIGVALLIAGLYLAGAVTLIEVSYHFIYHQSPQWSAYSEYARAFTGGFGTMTIDPRGSVWALLLLHTGLLAALVSVDQRRPLALIWAAWGTFWSVSTYYVARSHPNNISNLGPVLLLVIGTLVQAVKNSDRRALVRPWIWMVVVPWLGAVLWLVATNSAAVGRQLAGYQVVPRVDRLLPTEPEAGAGELLAECQRLHPEPFSVLGPDGFACTTIELTTAHPNWLPLRSLPLYGPLPVERREHYLAAYHPRARSGWLLAPLELDRDNSAWLFAYIEARYTAAAYLRNGTWQAWYYVPQAPRAAGVPSGQDEFQLLTQSPGAALRFGQRFGGNVDPRQLTASARIFPGSSGEFIGATTGATELRVGVPANRLQVEMVLRRADGDAGGPLAADFAAYASPPAQPDQRYERWRGRVELAAGEPEVTVRREIDGSGLSTVYTLAIPPEAAGRVVAGWRMPRVTHVAGDPAAPAWLSSPSAPAIRLDEAALARLLPDHWRPAEAWMHGAWVTATGIELSPGGEIWLQSRGLVTKFAGRVEAAPSAVPERMAEILAIWYKGGRLEHYAAPRPPDPVSGARFFEARSAEAGGWLVIAAENNPAKRPVVVRVTGVEEAK